MATRNSSGIPAVGYLRRSTDLQERSIPDQRAYIEKWAAEHGYRIVRWYIDDAISGTSTKGRNGFEQMIAAAENGRDFDAILCYDISRFSRGGTNETGYYVHRLHMAGVEVVFTADGIPEGDEGELIQGVKSWQARQYSVKLARDSIRGQISNIRERKSAPGGQPPYGYDKQHITPDGKVVRTLRWMADGSKLEFDAEGKLVRTIAGDVYVAKAKGDIVRYAPSTPERVQAIQRMFDLSAKGYGFKYIAERFNEEGVPTMFGFKWNTSNIAQMLRSPVYYGALAYNKRTSGSLFSMDANGKLKAKKGKRGNFKNQESDWIIVPDVHEPLVSKETFDAVQAGILKRRDAGGKGRSVRRTLVSTLLVCKRCGMSFTTVRDHRRKPELGGPYRHYTCSGYHRYGKNVCGLVRIPGPALDEFVLKVIGQVLQGDAKTRKQAIDAFVKALSKPIAVTNGSEQRRELDQINRRIKTTVALLADPTFDGLDDIHAVLAELKRKRDSLMNQQKASDATARPALTQQQLRVWAGDQLARLDEIAAKAEITLADRQLVEAFVQRIEIEPDTNTGTIILYADLQSAFASTQVVGGDDPQTDESARSLSQCATREGILAGAILGLAGPGKKISGIMPCTVIRPSDMADNILSRDKHPEWNGERTKMVYSFPTEEKKWQRYGELRGESLRAYGDIRLATEFYAADREAMDAGAEIAWPERFNHDELSAIQHSMNLKLQDEAAFFAEYQNEPLPEVTSEADELTADQIASKTNRVQRRLVPVGCNHLTMFVDVQANLLFFVVAAWEDDFTGYVIDYGSFPDQQRPYFTLRDARLTLPLVTKASGVEGAIYAGLEQLTSTHLRREWRRDDGAMLRIERCLIDANWGASTDVVYQFCRQSAHAGIVMPSHGRFVGASSQPFSEYKRRPGDRVGHNWRMPNVAGKRAVRHVVYDTNFWKSFVHARLAVPMGDRGCLSLFGDSADQHRLFAEHLTAEYRVKTEGRGRTVDEWKTRPERGDNHWLDCLVGCAAAASIQGVVLEGTGGASSPVKRDRVSFAELQRRRRQ
jgi:DNA invertase Pin-like site-specific DNA recombinase